MHKLVDKMTEARVESQLRAWRRGEDVEKPNEAQEKGFIRRRLCLRGGLWSSPFLEDESSRRRGGCFGKPEEETVEQRGGDCKG